MSNLHEQQIRQHNNPAVYKEKPVQSNMQSNLDFGQPIKMFAVQPGTYQNPRRNKNLIVNPLLSLQQVSVPEQDLVPSINQSHGRMVNSIYGVEDELGQIQSDKEDSSVSEPIYAEIKPRPLEVIEGKTDLDANKTTLNNVVKEEICANSSAKKKEIEYWQITAKEVAKFKPCMETFIKRE